MGFDSSDDACVYRLRDDLALIQTLDFFPPVVDDPFLYGQIAAANALSDVYAMGGEPSLALNILCFPTCLPLTVMEQILAGGCSKVQEAGAILAGGHTIDDPVPKYGLCVSGFIHPRDIWTNAGAQTGDVLLLTKPLGSGIVNTAAKADMLTAEQFQPTLDAMATLNKYARDAAVDIGISACTDITGFGMLGHTSEMARASGKTILLDAGAIPCLPHAQEMAELGIIPGGAYKNREYVEKDIHFGESVPLYLQDILCDPQTSGGLLLSIRAELAEELLARLRIKTPDAAIVGRVANFDGISVRVK